MPGFDLYHLNILNRESSEIFLMITTKNIAWEE
jgi:hypothetical protein